MTVENDTFSNNYAKNGGAIYNAGTLDIIGSKFDHNNADGGNGGAIYNAESGVINNIKGTIFTASNADASDPDKHYESTTGRGGAIYNSGRIGNIENVRFKDNVLVDGI